MNSPAPTPHICSGPIVPRTKPAIGLHAGQHRPLTFHKAHDDAAPASVSTVNAPAAIDVNEVLNLIPGRRIISDAPAPAIEQTPAGETETESTEETPVATAPVVGSPEWLAAQPAEVQAYFATLSKPAVLEPVKQEAPKPAEKPAVRASEPNPLSTIADFAQLQEAVDRSEAAREWALANFDGGVIQLADGAEREITAAEARTMFAHHDKLLRKHAPMRAQELQVLAAREAEVPNSLARAQEAYEWMKDEKSEAYQQFQQLAGQLPELKRFSEWPEFLADTVAGFMARKGKAKAPAAPAKETLSPAPSPAPATAPAPKRPMSPPSGGSAGGTQRSSPLYEQSVRKLAAGGGSRDAVVGFLESLYGGAN